MMNSFICKYCSKEFLNKRSYNAHIWQCKLNPNHKNKKININGFNKLNEECDNLFCKYCKRKCKSLNSLYTHERQCKFNKNRNINNIYKTALQKYNEGLKSGEIKSWNKGLTKYTDPRVRKNGESYHNNILLGKTKIYWLGKHHSKETIEKMKANPNNGGYRKGSGRGKKGTYKGYYCDSSWELAFVIYNLEHDIEFKRNKQLFEYEYNGETHKYMPDFIINDIYYEIKGYWTKQWQVKYDSFKKEHKIEVIDKEKIKPYLEYVIQKYGENYTKLYEKWEGSSNGRAEA